MSILNNTKILTSITDIIKERRFSYKFNIKIQFLIKKYLYIGKRKKNI